MKKILIVSSSKSFLERSSNLLNGKEFQVNTAQSGAEALRLHMDHSFDLILSDMHLQDMGGDILCSTVRNGEVAKNPIIILICYESVDDHERVVRCGADAKIIRPVQPEQIIETIGNLLNIQVGRTKRAIFTVKVFAGKGKVEFDCISIDISITGILLETEYRLAVGDRIICRFALPGESQIEVEGDVVRSLDPHNNIRKFGVQFIGLPLSCRKQIERYVESVRLKVTESNLVRLKCQYMNRTP